MILRFMTVAAIGLAMTVVSASAQNELQKEPGYFDVRQVEGWFDDEPKIEVNIRGALLSLVTEATRYDDPDLSALLSGLKAIQVRGFNVRRSDQSDVRTRARSLGNDLRQRGWETVVRVREDDEVAEMYLLASDESIAGMVVFVVDGNQDEAMFINIVGEIQPDQIGRIGRKFNIGVIEDEW